MILATNHEEHAYSMNNYVRIMGNFVSFTHTKSNKNGTVDYVNFRMSVQYQTPTGDTKFHFVTCKSFNDQAISIYYKINRFIPFWIEGEIDNEGISVRTVKQGSILSIADNTHDEINVYKANNGKPVIPNKEVDDYYKLPPNERPKKWYNKNLIFSAFICNDSRDCGNNRYSVGLVSYSGKSFIAPIYGIDPNKVKNVSFDTGLPYSSLHCCLDAIWVDRDNSFITYEVVSLKFPNESREEINDRLKGIYYYWYTHSLNIFDWIYSVRKPSFGY